MYLKMSSAKISAMLFVLFCFSKPTICHSTAFKWKLCYNAVSKSNVWPDISLCCYYARRFQLWPENTKHVLTEKYDIVVFIFSSAIYATRSCYQKKNSVHTSVSVTLKRLCAITVCSAGNSLWAATTTISTCSHGMRWIFPENPF